MVKAKGRSVKSPVKQIHHDDNRFPNSHLYCKDGKEKYTAGSARKQLPL
jgi:hypothetical protein